MSIPDINEQIEPLLKPHKPDEINPPYDNELEQLRTENKRLREALEYQDGLWNLAKDQLDKFDDTLSRVRFTTLHNPQGHIAAALKDKP